MEQNTNLAAAHSAATGVNRAPWYRFMAKGPKSQENVLWIIDDVGDAFGGVTVQDFSRDMAALDQSLPLRINLNSNGGDVFCGIAIGNIIRSYKSETVSHVLGVAASIASYICIAADRTIMHRDSFLMIHNCWTFTCGDANKLRRVANDMDQINEQLINAYLGRVKNNALSRSEISEMMANETWISSASALQYGLCDEISADSQRIAASLSRESQRFKNFKNLPSELAAAPGAVQDNNALSLMRKRLNLLG